jgi:glycosyltransferase involved in cell wall biosynthesis
MVGKALGKEEVHSLHPENRSFREFLDKYKDAKNINRVGFVSNKELVGIFNLATLYCQPSLYEGFGLPVLEAMACGAPVVASKTQALVEVAQDAAYYFDPKDSDDMAKKIKKAMENDDLRDDLIKRAKGIVEKYSWEKSAQDTIGVYRHVCESK